MTGTVLVATGLVSSLFPLAVRPLLALTLYVVVKARCMMDEFSHLPLLMPEWALGSQDCPHKRYPALFQVHPPLLLLRPDLCPSHPVLQQSVQVLTNICSKSWRTIT